MYIKVLVEQDIENGRRFVKTLQKLMPIDAAFWSNDEEANKWKLKIVSHFVAAGGHSLGRDLVWQALAESKVPIASENISFASPVSLEYKRVRRAIEGAAEIPEAGWDLGDVYIYATN